MRFSQKILVIRFSSIGDIVLATSPLNTIRSAFPDAKITFLTLEKFSSLLEFHPHIDRLISIPSKMKFRELFADMYKRKDHRLVRCFVREDGGVEPEACICRVKESKPLLSGGTHVLLP